MPSDPKRTLPELEAEQTHYTKRLQDLRGKLRGAASTARRDLQRKVSACQEFLAGIESEIAALSTQGQPRRGDLTISLGLDGDLVVIAPDGRAMPLSVSRDGWDTLVGIVRRHWETQHPGESAPGAAPAFRSRLGLEPGTAVVFCPPAHSPFRSSQSELFRDRESEPMLSGTFVCGVHSASGEHVRVEFDRGVFTVPERWVSLAGRYVAPREVKAKRPNLVAPTPETTAMLAELGLD